VSELEPHRDQAEPTGSEVHEDGPVIVVTAMELRPEARDALAERLGPGHVVRDIREAGNTADLVLVPATSPQLVGGLRAMFPGARILVTEFTDPLFEADFAGPVARSAASGVDGYFVVPSLDELAAVTYLAAQGRPMAGLLTTGRSALAELGRGTPPAGSNPATRGGLRLIDAGSESTESETGGGQAESDETGAIMIDLDQWAVDDTLRRFARMIIDQLRDQGVEVVVRTSDPDAWSVPDRPA
jgi:hypothetical protein